MAEAIIIPYLTQILQYDKNIRDLGIGVSKWNGMEFSWNGVFQME